MTNMNTTTNKNYSSNRYFAKFNHVCELTDLEDPIEIYYPGDTLWSSIKRKFARYRTISDSRRDNKYRRTLGTVNDERSRHLEENPWMIHPLSDFRVWWDFHMTIIFALTLFFVPITTVSFWSTTGAPQFITTMKYFRFIILCCDFFLIINFILNFFTGIIHHKETDKVQMNQEYVMIRYWKGYFWIDIWTVVPIQFICFFIDDHEEFAHIYQFSKALTYFQYLNCFFRSCENFKVDYCKKIMILLISSIIFYFQWVCCMLMFVYLWNCGVLTETFDDDGDKVKLTKALSLVEPLTNRTYLSANASYIGSLYRATMIILLVDYGRALPYNDEERILMIVIWFTSKFILIQILSYIYKVTKTKGSANYKYVEMLRQLKEFMSHKHLPVYMQKRLFDYYEFRYQNTYFNEHKIIDSISGNLKQEMIVRSCSKLVEKVTFFKNLPTPLLIQIVSCLRTEIYLTNDMIIKAKTKGNCMYFISSGTVAIYTKAGQEIYHLEDGSHFGEMALVIPRSKRSATVVAIEICQLYKLKKKDFNKVIRPYPDLIANIEKITTERLEVMNLLDERVGHNAQKSSYT